MTSRLCFSDVVFVFRNWRQMLNLTDRVEPRRLLCHVTAKQHEREPGIKREENKAWLYGVTRMTT